MAERPPTYTDKVWKTEMKEIRDAINGTLTPVMEQMLAGQHRLDAGRTQVALFTRALTMTGELATDADLILDRTGARYGPVNEAQAAAGGLGEVYGDKHAHQAG
jgi:hypothetical protein